MANDQDDAADHKPTDTPKEEKQITLNETELHAYVEENVREVITTIERSEQFYGPVPHPDHMRAYKAIDKSLPGRFTTMAEKNQSHHMFIEKLVVMGELVMGVLGWLTPTALSFYVLSAAIGFVEDDKSIEALVSLVIAIASLGGAFYMKKRAQEPEKE